MKKKIFIIIVLLAILIALIFLFFSQKSTPQALAPTNSTTKTSKQFNSSPAMVNGWLKCLSSKTTGINCVIGIENASGQDYALIEQNGKLLSPIKLTTGTRYTAVGSYVATPKFLQNYKIEGTIKLK